MALTGKHALITGSSRGIGRGIALALAADGARVAVHYYENEAAADDTLARVRERGSDGFTVRADVRRPEAIEDMFSEVEGEFGKLDIFVSNARDWHGRGWTPMRRLGTPADVGRAVLLLCSEQASWITGQLIHVDGGMSVMDPGLPLEIQQA